MRYGSKIKLFLIVAIPVFVLCSCRNAKNDVIPDVYVNFTIDLLDPQFINLSAMGGSDTIDGRTNNWGYRAEGFNGNGIIVYTGPDEYYAYDRTCPHDYAVNGLSVKVKIDPVDFTSAVCPQCGTKYGLSVFGTPVSGVSKYPLKNYKTRFDGRYITVWNN